MPIRKKLVKAVGRTLEEFAPLKPGEAKLLDACRTGDVAMLDDKRPEQATADNTVRASFVRFLALGGDESAPVHEHGVQLQGAWIEGRLDLHGAHIFANLVLFHCHFGSAPILRDTHIQGCLLLSGSHMPGLNADRLVSSGGVFLRDGFHATEEVILLGAQIGSDLDCGSAKLDGQKSAAFSADSAVIKGSVLLNQEFSATGEVRLLGAQIGGDLSCGSAHLDGKEGSTLFADHAVIKGSVLLNQEFSATGEVRLLGAQIGGDLNCGSAQLDGKDSDALSADGAVIKGCVFLNKGFSATGEVRLLGAQIGGNFDCGNANLNGKEGDALSADGMVVSGNFFFRNLQQPVHGVSLNHAYVARLIDDKAAWGERLVLDGFAYGSFAGGAPTDASTRLAWLDKQCEENTGANGKGDNFHPQPWRQLQKVLRDMGHMEDARQVGIEFENRLRKAGLIGQTTASKWSPRYWFVRPLKNGFHALFGILIGYGYRPLLLAGWMLGVWLACAAFYWFAAIQGVFAPSNPLVFQHPAYAVCVPGSDEAKAELAKPAPIVGAGNWYLCEKLREEYTGFSPLTYSLDVILPLVDLQQEHDWSTLIPTPRANWFEELFAWDLKRITRFVIWLEILFGWVASLLMVAVVSGLTKRRED